MRRAGVFLVVFLLLPLRVWAAQGVADTVHNLSVTGPGPIKSETVTEICVFCHTPHNARPSVPLWNHRMSGATYLEYESSTLQAKPGQPTGTSRLCLACHDGTVALGALGNLPRGQANKLRKEFLKGRANLGTDLSDDHPISFAFDSELRAKNPKLAKPAQIDVPLEGGQLQCGSCHDPHEKTTVPFLRKTAVRGELCLSCHDMASGEESWATSSHAVSTARPRGNARNPWSERKPKWRGQTVAENACFNCHAPHNALTPQRLIKDHEEKTCFLCHDGNVAKTDIRSEVVKPYRHPVDLSSGVHDPAEDFAGQQPSSHVECADCHEPHVATNRPERAPRVPGALAGVKGIDAAGAAVPQARNLYEVCFKCHGDNSAMSRPVVTRQVLEVNTRLEFDISNPSFHPVQGVGRSRNVPSLLGPWTDTSVIDCADCHNNDSGPGNAGSGPKGPHGSVYQGLLERNYATADNTAESIFAYALCYKCHNRSSILADQSFPEHRLHVVDSNTPCSACHDPHGISSVQGNPFNNSHLINFDLTIALPSALGDGPLFEDLGEQSGQCSLNCHGKDHQSLRY